MGLHNSQWFWPLEAGMCVNQIRVGGEKKWIELVFSLLFMKEWRGQQTHATMSIILLSPRLNLSLSLQNSYIILVGRTPTLAPQIQKCQPKLIAPLVRSYSEVWPQRCAKSVQSRNFINLARFADPKKWLQAAELCTYCRVIADSCSWDIVFPKGMEPGV